MLQSRRERRVIAEPHPLERVAPVSTGAPLTIGNFLGLAAETETLSEWATKHSYVFIWLLYLLGRCCNWLSWSATAPTSRKLPPSWGLGALWGLSWARCWCWAPVGPALRRSVPGGWSSQNPRYRAHGIAGGGVHAIVGAPGRWLVAVRASRAESTGLPASNHHDTYHRGDRWFSTLASHGART